MPRRAAKSARRRTSAKPRIVVASPRRKSAKRPAARKSATKRPAARKSAAKRAASGRRKPAKKSPAKKSSAKKSPAPAGPNNNLLGAWTVPQATAILKRVVGAFEKRGFGHADKLADRFYHELPDGAILKMKTVRAVAQGRATVLVAEPQTYDHVVRLTSRSDAFQSYDPHDPHGDVGWFAGGSDDEFAVTGSGGDRWWVLNSTLVNHLLYYEKMLSGGRTAHTKTTSTHGGCRDLSHIRKYAARPSPAYSAQSCPGQTRAGKSGEPWTSKPVWNSKLGRNVHRWVRV